MNPLTLIMIGTLAVAQTMAHGAEQPPKSICTERFQKELSRGAFGSDEPQVILGMAATGRSKSLLGFPVIGAATVGMSAWAAYDAVQIHKLKKEEMGNTIQLMEEAQSGAVGIHIRNAWDYILIHHPEIDPTLVSVEDLLELVKQLDQHHTEKGQSFCAQFNIWWGSRGSVHNWTYGKEAVTLLATKLKQLQDTRSRVE